MDGSQVHQRSRGGGIQFHGFLVSLDHFRKRRAGLLQLQPALEPVLGGGALDLIGIDWLGLAEFQQALQLYRVEIEQQLAGFGLHGAAVDFHANAFSVGVDLELSERIVDIAEFLNQRG